MCNWRPRKKGYRTKYLKKYSWNCSKFHENYKLENLRFKHPSRINIKKLHQSTSYSTAETNKRENFNFGRKKDTSYLTKRTKNISVLFIQNSSYKPEDNGKVSLK